MEIACKVVLVVLGVAAVGFLVVFIGIWWDERKREKDRKGGRKPPAL